MSEQSIEKRFGELMRKLRYEKRQNQEDFADYLGLDRSYQGRIERGEINISIRKIDRIAKALGLKIGELLTLLDQD